MNQNEILAIPAHITCPVDKALATVSGVLTEGQIRIYVYQCDCGAIIVLGSAPNALPASLKSTETGESIPALLLQETVSKVATLPNYTKQIKGVQ